MLLFACLPTNFVFSEFRISTGTGTGTGHEHGYKIIDREYPLANPMINEGRNYNFHTSDVSNNFWSLVGNTITRWADSLAIQAIQTVPKGWPPPPSTGKIKKILLKEVIVSGGEAYVETECIDHQRVCRLRSNEVAKQE